MGRVCVAGARGFIGNAVARTLRANGLDVLELARSDADFATAENLDALEQRLSGVDAVVNCVGILREHIGESFDAVHDTAPRALGDAAARAGVRRFVQISALGDAGTPFIASKHRGDARLLACKLPVTVLRPSLVYSPRRASGGSALLRGIAAFPFLLPLPGGGTQRLQPIDLDDLARIVVAAIRSEKPLAGIYEVGGPQVIELRTYLGKLRRWLGIAASRRMIVPRWCVAAVARIGDRLHIGPVGVTTWRVLEAGLELSSGALEQQCAAFGVGVRTMDEVLAAVPSTDADRRAARRYFLSALPTR